MSLVRFDGARQVEHDLCGLYRGRDFLICCPGPSLKKIDPATLHSGGAVVLAVNTAYPHVAKPDVWVGMDSPDCYAESLMDEPFLKVLGTLYLDDVWRGRPLKAYPNTSFATGAGGKPWEIFMHLGANDPFLWNKNTMWVAIHVAAWMGAGRIGLAGVDLGGASDYHDGRVLPNEQKTRNADMMRQAALDFPEVVAAALDRGVTFVSCTEDSPICRVMPYMPVSEFIARSAVSACVLDGADAELLRTKAVDAPMGVMTGADSAQEWLLPWWWARYSAANQYPVVFADFGLSDKMRQWCGERGRVLVTDWKRGGPTWFRKPFAMCGTPFRRTIWIDADCEVHGNVLGLFANIPGNGGLLVARDKPDRFSTVFPEGGPVNSGVVGYLHDSPHVRRWGREVLKPRMEYHGDQGALNAILADQSAAKVLEQGGPIRMRLDPLSPGQLITHWTGPEGKREIASQIEGARKAAQGGQPLVSVLMPAHNAAPYIREAIVSTLSQTYKNLELVIVDDASTDGTLAVIQSAAKGDNRVKVIASPYQIGYPAAFNMALRAARGQIIARMDADDTQFPARIEAEVTGMIQTKADAITCGHQDCDAMNRVQATRPVVGLMQETNYRELWAAGGFNQSKAPHCPTTLAWRRVYEAAGEFDSVDYGPDTRWNFRALERGAKFAHVVENLYLYRKHGEQMTPKSMEAGMPVCIRAAKDSAEGRYHPAIFGGEWLDPQYEMTFNRPVNIYVNRLPLGRPAGGAFNVYLGISEPAELMEPTANILAADWLDLAITIDPKVLAEWPQKAVKMAFGGSWLLGEEPDVEKKFGVSFLCGFKQDRPGHLLRQEIWKRQEELYIPKKFWGSSRGGVNLIDDDNEWFPVPAVGMRPADKHHLFDKYQFNIAVESARENDYFTEKLVDCFLSRTVPIYWGCPNIGEYFDAAGMILVDSADDLFTKLRRLPPDAYATMQEAVEENFRRAQEYATPLGRRVRAAIAERIRTTTTTAGYWENVPPAAYEAHGEKHGNPEGWDIVAMTASMFRDMHSIVDWGCGTGRYTKEFHAEAYTGVDINPAALAAARAANPQYRFVHGETFPEAEAYLFMTVMLHMPDEDVRNILRRVKDAGARVIVIGEILGREWRRDGDPRVWNRELEEYIALMAEQGYALTDIYSKPCAHYANNPAWDRMKNRNVHLLRFEIPSLGHRTELARGLDDKSIAVEVGVWEGVFSRSLLAMGKGAVYSVDPWRVFDHADYKDFQEDTPAHWEARYQRVKTLLSPFGERSKILRVTSAQAATEFADGWLDLVYLDANHVYEAITEDIALWWPKIKPGGVLAGHDFTTNKTCGVELAVNEFCAKEKLTLTFLHDFGPPTWVVRKPCPV